MKTPCSGGLHRFLITNEGLSSMPTELQVGLAVGEADIFDSICTIHFYKNL